MADRIPLKQRNPSDPTVGLAAFEATDTVPLSNGGTGVTSLAALKTALGLDPVLINGQPHTVFADSVRSKNLSESMVHFMWTEADINTTEWLQVGAAVDTLSGYIMPYDATIVGITATCENTNGFTKPLDLYINAANNGNIITIPNGSPGSITDVTLDIDLDQGEGIRLKANGGGGIINDTVISMFIRWRAA